MKFNVYMTAFMNGEIREVDVPDNDLGGNVHNELERIFYWGQNDFQSVFDRCSVSAGDVIDYNGTLYLVLMADFCKISTEQFEHYKSVDHHARMNYIIK